MVDSVEMDIAMDITRDHPSVISDRDVMVMAADDIRMAGHVVRSLTWRWMEVGLRVVETDCKTMYCLCDGHGNTRLKYDEHAH